MSTSSRSASQDAEAARTERRSKRKERARSAAPEPKNIVSGAGQPLDPGVRRELEERLGHDFGQVRLHTDRDAGALTELLGADAVAVGQDIFFREGAYVSGTADGQRLLAHELLHTVQNPHGLGTLRAGRDLGAVSLPQQAIEQEAESTARDLVRDGLHARDEEPSTVEKGQSTPGWLRYATVDADRRRMEELDPATLLDRLAHGVVRSLRGDPEDRSGRVRLQLARMAPQVQDLVLDRLELRLTTPVLDRLLDLVDETEQQGPLPLAATGAPEAVPGEAEDIAQERERESAEEKRQPTEGTGHGRREPGPQGEDGKSTGDGETAEESTAPGGRGGAGADGNTTSPEQAASQDRGEAAARQQDRSQERQEDRNASAERDAPKDEAGAEEERESSGPEEEATAQEQEQQAAEQEPQQTEGPAGSPAVSRGAAAAPAAVDRSGAEPGEKARTGGDPGTARAAGDPENEEGTDDEPLGLESESADGAEEQGDAAADEEAGRGDVPVPGIDLVGYTDAAKNPSLVEERRKGTAARPSLPSTTAELAPDAVQDQTESDTPQDSPSRSEAEEESERRAIQDLLGVSSADQDLGSTENSGAGDSGLAGSGPTATPMTDSAETRWEKKQTEERGEDAEAERRDEEARTADGAGGGAVSGPGETAAPRQLDKAGEDARSQGAGTASSGSAAESRAAGADGSGQADTARESGRAADSQSAAGTAGTETDAGSGGTAETGTDRAGGGGNTGQETPAPGPSAVPADQDVTEGKGPATSPAPQSGPDKVSAPGPVSAPAPAPGNGPAPMAGQEAKANSPKATGAPRAGSTGAGPRARPTGAKRQAARQAAKTVRRGGGGGGGSRSASASAPAPGRAGRGGGRAGGSGAGKAKKEAPAPDVSNATPESGLATAAGLKPHQALETLKGVDGAVGRSVDKERTTLRKAPPKTRRPSGSPRTVPGGPTVAAPGTYTNAKVARTQAAQGSTPEITGEQKPEGELPGSNVPEPSWWDIAVTIGAQLFGSLLKEILPLDDLIDSILGLPTKDEGLRNAKVGDAPRLPLEDDSDPQRTDEQSRKLDERKNELHQSGRTDAGLPMGEDQIYPDVPGETLTGKVSGGKKTAKGSGPRSVSGGVPIESASAVAEHDRGPQIQAGFTEGRQKMGQERRTKDQKAQQDRQKHDQDLKREVDVSSEKQSDARDKGRTDIADSRDQWRKEQDDKVAEIDGKKGKKYEKVRQDITDKEKETDEDVDKRTEDDNQRITDTQNDAEREAEEKQDEGKSDADNWLEEAIEKLKEFFEELKNAIKTVFEEARRVVTDLIDRFKQAVFQLIDDARNWVIDQINVFADALIALGDELLADYPAMRDKWRNTIDGARDWAVEKVNEFADALKEVAGKLLDGLCDALVAGLDLLETGLLAAVDMAETVTVGALEFGAAVVQGLGEWAAIFNDIVSDPGDWISKAGAAAETGAQDHLFEEIKTAVKAWFNQKVQEIIGIPMEDFQELLDGGVTAEQMGQMAWDEALPQLPLIIGVLVVEKVVAKLIPGAGWVMAIIDALQTAWGALSEILAAFGLFMDFLKSVKSGNGALPFAKAVAAGVVALLELVYQFLIEGVGRFMGKVADRLGDMLKNLRKKKPGPSDSPGQPDPPGKPRNDEPATAADDRTPTTDRPATDRPATDRPAPRKPTADQTSRPRPKPSPGKRSSPEKKPRPSHTTRPKERHDDETRREDGREVNAARRRARDAERRTRDEDRDGPTSRPTRRGPARDTLRPDRRRPDSDRTNDRDRDRDPRNTRREDRRRPDDRRRDDDRRDERRRDTDKDRRPGDRPRRRPLRRARQTIKSAVNRARRAGRRLYGKTRRRIGSRLNDRLRRLLDRWRRRQEGQHDRRRREERRPQERTREQEMPRVVFRNLDGETHTLMFRGRGPGAEMVVRSQTDPVERYLKEWEGEARQIEDAPDRRDRQLASIRSAWAEHRVTAGIQRRLPAKGTTAHSPTGQAAYSALHIALRRLAGLLELREVDPNDPPLLPMILPAYTDGVRAAGFQATGINKSIKNHKGQKPRGNNLIPLGWQLVPPQLRNETAWVRMHMFTEKFGGKASASNLVPAPGTAVNSRFAYRIELPAHKSITKDPQVKMIWYNYAVNFYPAPDEYFPKKISMSWGKYGATGNTWRKQPAEGHYTRDGIERPTALDSRFDINGKGPDSISSEFGVSRAFALAVRDQSPYRDIYQLMVRLKVHKRNLNATAPRKLRNFEKELKAVVKKKGNIRFT
ncbi:eCIS core domain-containing protein [Streptomyces odonnellii]|uniref:eCIS core domain-containing protein n=1 Tax=Streptomyces odonnellii TaxID=1417980 RepID=UPI0006260FC0|nr:DUF4157 domain-containing protein [Streptomyces odonnellii]